jgi:hypothetical protein
MSDAVKICSSALAWAALDPTQGPAWIQGAGFLLILLAAVILSCLVMLKGRGLRLADVPGLIIPRLKSLKRRINNEKYKRLSTQQVFTKIYEEAVWGRPTGEGQKYFSGGGSHDSLVANSYIEALAHELGAFEEKPDMVDLGCGDFAIGARLRPLCARYVACDIVEPLIQFNRDRFKEMNVEFKVLDITKDDLPDADLVCIRQVFQHLSNEQIANALKKIVGKYKILIITEHLPLTDPFVPNLDKPTGPDVRKEFNSGIVLTSAPFHLQARGQRCISEWVVSDGRIRTIRYDLA